MNRFVAWIFILGALGIVLVLFAYAFKQTISGGAILALILCTFLIGGVTSAACYRLACILGRYSEAVHLAVNLGVAFVLGVTFSFLIVRFLLPAIAGTLPLLPYTAATTILSMVITTLTTVLERRMGLLAYANEVVAPAEPRNVATIEALSLREGLNHYIVPFEEIYYLSSADDRTVVHARHREYITGRPLKEILGTLPISTFLRIHKSFAVNLRYLSRLEYMAGGQLLAHLKDDDESSIPVGRRFAPDLKQRFGLMRNVD